MREIVETFTYKGWTVHLEPTQQSDSSRWCAGFVLSPPGEGQAEKIRGPIEDPRGFCYEKREEALQKSRALAVTYLDHGHAVGQ